MTEYQMAPPINASKSGTEYVRHPSSRASGAYLTVFKKAIDEYSTKADGKGLRVTENPYSVNLSFCLLCLIPVAIFLVPGAISVRARCAS